MSTATYRLDDITTAIVSRDGPTSVVVIVQSDNRVALTTVAIERLAYVFDSLDDTNDEAEAFRIT